MNTESRCLLNGKVYCMDCGSRLIVATNGRYMINGGEKSKRLRYMCYGKSRKQTNCQGQTSYSAKRLDNVVDGIIRHIFEDMRNISKKDVVSSGIKALQKELECRYNAAQRDYVKGSSDLAELKNEVLKSIRGEGKFSQDLLSELIEQTEKSLAEVKKSKDILRNELDGCTQHIDNMLIKYDEVLSWTELYDAADWNAKKMIVANLINRIDVGTDYQIHINLNVELEHYNISLNCVGDVS
jgi:hypothetical protein